MANHFRHSDRAAIAALSIFLVLGTAFAGNESSFPDVVQIGVSKSLFRDAPPALTHALMQPFRLLMESQTGLKSQLISVNANDLGRLLDNDKVHVGIFQGIEFAWAKQQHANLRPLALAINRHMHVRACLVVAKNNPARHFSDLKGSGLEMPSWAGLHCNLFLDRLCQANHLPEPQRFLGKTIKSSNAEDPLDDVIDGVTQAALVEKLSLECFRRRKPGRGARLKVLEESDDFPAVVIAYKDRRLDTATLDLFQDGLFNSNKTALGRQLLTLLKLTAVVPVPGNYQIDLKRIATAYPELVKTTDLLKVVGDAKISGQR